MSKLSLVIPALLIKMSIFPNVSIAFLTRLLQLSALLTSQAIPIVLILYCDASSDAIFVACSCFRPLTIM